jgi:hypothetical protein
MATLASSLSAPTNTDWRLALRAPTPATRHRVFHNPDFIDGRVDTTWIERVFLSPKG